MFRRNNTWNNNLYCISYHQTVLYIICVIRDKNQIVIHNKAISSQPR